MPTGQLIGFAEAEVVSIAVTVGHLHVSEGLRTDPLRVHRGA